MVGRVLLAMFLIFGAAVAACVLMILVVDAVAWLVRKWDDRDRRKLIAAHDAAEEREWVRSQAEARYASYLAELVRSGLQGTAAEIWALPEVEPKRRVA